MLWTMMYVSHGPEETVQIARAIARDLVFMQTNQPLIIALTGELGAGKTTFVQAFTTELGVIEKVKSPTFTIFKKYAIHQGTYTTLYHMDWYRLQSSRDLVALGVAEILKQPDAIVLIEWADRVPDILPRNTLSIHIDHAGEHIRNITYEKTGSH